MRYPPIEYLPYTYREMRPGFLGVGFDFMACHRDVLGHNRGCHHIEAFYKGRPVVIGRPKRYKHQRN